MRFRHIGSAGGAAMTTRHELCDPLVSGYETPDSPHEAVNATTAHFRAKLKKVRTKEIAGAQHERYQLFNPRREPKS
jgi:hypothetical protein